MRDSKRGRVFKKGDLLIYLFLLIFFGNIAYKGYNMPDKKGSKAEIYVEGKLKYVQNLQKDEKNIFVDSELGGVNIQFENMKVKVTSSNSPKKLIVKQGWIAKPGEILIGIPDKVIIKIIGEGDDELDYVAK
ncbi:MAG: NusG domain II-containing protein [Fusobacteriaceae bacterium]